MNHFHKLILLLALVTFLTPFTVFAQPGDPTPRLDQVTEIAQEEDEDDSKVDTSQQNRGARRCQVVSNRLKNRVERLDLVKTHRAKRYERLTSKFQTLVSRLEAAGVDTTTLKAHLTELQTKIQTYNDDLALYHQAMTKVSGITCANQAAFQSALKDARTALKQVGVDVKAINTFLKETLRPHLQTLKAQLEAGESDE